MWLFFLILSKYASSKLCSVVAWYKKSIYENAYYVAITSKSVIAFPQVRKI